MKLPFYLVIPNRAVRFKIQQAVPCYLVIQRRIIQTRTARDCIMRRGIPYMERILTLYVIQELAEESGEA